MLCVVFPVMGSIVGSIIRQRNIIILGEVQISDTVIGTYNCDVKQMDLGLYRLSRWEKDILEEFNTDDCLKDLMVFIPESAKQLFLIRLADSLFSFKKNQFKS